MPVQETGPVRGSGLHGPLVVTRGNTSDLLDRIKTRGTTLPFVVCVAGESGSGKGFVTSRLVENLQEQLPGQSISVLSTDNYYLDDVPDGNFDHPQSIDSEKLITDLAKIRAGQAVSIPHYDEQKEVSIPDAEILHLISK